MVAADEAHRLAVDLGRLGSPYILPDGALSSSTQYFEVRFDEVRLRSVVLTLTWYHSGRAVEGTIFFSSFAFFLSFLSLDGSGRATR